MGWVSTPHHVMPEARLTKTRSCEVGPLVGVSWWLWNLKLEGFPSPKGVALPNKCATELVPLSLLRDAVRWFSVFFNTQHNMRIYRHIWTPWFLRLQHATLNKYRQICYCIYPLTLQVTCAKETRKLYNAISLFFLHVLPTLNNPMLADCSYTIVYFRVQTENMFFFSLPCIVQLDSRKDRCD